jgi:hypothetical protein
LMCKGNKSILDLGIKDKELRYVCLN